MGAGIPRHVRLVSAAAQQTPHSPLSRYFHKSSPPIWYSPGCSAAGSLLQERFGLYRLYLSGDKAGERDGEGRQGVKCRCDSQVAENKQQGRRVPPRRFVSAFPL